MKKLISILGIASILAGGLIVTLFSQAAPASVTISLNVGGSPEIVLDVDPVTIDLGGQVRWVSVGSRSDTIRIDFLESNGRSGPFPATGAADNPQRGRYTKQVGSPIITLPASEDEDRGSWKYNIVWTTADGTVYELDPMVIVRGS